MLDNVSVIILPFLIYGIIEHVPNLSITHGIKKTSVNENKINSLTLVYKIFVFILMSIVAILSIMSSFPESDVFNIFDNKNTDDLIALFLNTAPEKDNYYSTLPILFLVSLITPVLFYAIGSLENKKSNGNNRKQLLKDLLIRILMFFVGAFVAWLALIVLSKTPFEILDRLPVLLITVYLIVLLCLRINFRFQIKADRDEEKSPSVPGCIPICCSAVWCSFVYAMFGVSFLISFSTFRHINDFVVRREIYLIAGVDCRVLLIMASIAYVLLFIATNSKGFRGNAWYVFAFYVIAVSLIIFPMISANGKRTLNSLAVLLTFLFFYFCYRKIKKEAKQPDNIQSDEEADADSGKKSFRAKLNDIKEKIEPWTILTVGIAVLIILVAEVFPLVRQI